MEVGGRNLRKRKPPPTTTQEPAKRNKQQQPKAAGRRGRPRREPEPAVGESDSEEQEQEVEDAGASEDADVDADAGSSNEESDSNEIEVEPPVWRGAPKMATSRRAAPGGNPPASIVSMNVVGPNNSEYGNTQQSLLMSEADEAARRSLAVNIHQLDRLSRDLMLSYSQSSKSAAFPGMGCHIPRAAFDGARRLFPKVPGLGDDTLFIDPNVFEEFEPSPMTRVSAMDIVHRVNLVTALDMIEQLFENPKKAKPEDILRPITALDDYLHDLLLPFGDEAANVNYAFDLRVLRALQMLPSDRQLNRNNVASTLSSVFCVKPEVSSSSGQSKQDATVPLTEGPHRELCHRRGSDSEPGDDVEVLCSKRLIDILKRMIHNKKVPRVDEVRQEYEITAIFEKLSEWLSQVYFDSDPLKDHQEAGSVVGEDVEEHYLGRHSRLSAKPHVDEVESVVSQPIIRASDADPSRPPLYNAAGFAALDDGDSASEPEVDGANAAYMHDNAAILGSRPSRSNGSSAPTSSWTSTNGQRKQQQKQRSRGRDDEEEDDPFEMDTRPVSESRRLALEHRFSGGRSALPHSAQPSSAPSASMEAPPAPRQRFPSPVAEAPPSSSFAALREEKRKVSAAARATTVEAPTIRQRYPWSDADSQTLVELISLRHAAWSTIETSDGHKFEHPRNQQAYRDKARNMKVDMLLTDAVLPPNFDLVTLGKKEIDRVISFGKNPSRKVKDVDQGRAINTEYGGN